MLVTPEDAQKRWCPFGHQPMLMHGAAFAVAANRQPNGDVPSCLGPLCMAWRWYDPKIREIDLVSGELDGGPRRGYCGAFGQIQHGD